MIASYIEDIEDTHTKIARSIALWFDEPVSARCVWVVRRDQAAHKPRAQNHGNLLWKFGGGE